MTAVTIEKKSWLGKRSLRIVSPCVTPALEGSQCKERVQVGMQRILLLFRLSLKVLEYFLAQLLGRLCGNKQWETC